MWLKIKQNKICTKKCEKFFFNPVYFRDSPQKKVFKLFDKCLYINKHLFISNMSESDLLQVIFLLFESQF